MIAYQPQLATRARVPPVDRGWIFELKTDGYRMSVQVEDGRARLISRHGRAWSDSFPTVVQAALNLPLKAALLDGELTVVLPNGLTSFEALQHRDALPTGSSIALWAFDLLYLDGRDLRRRPLEERKALLEEVLIKEAPLGAIRYTSHIVGNGPDVLRHACALGAEGIVCKRLNAPHMQGRSRDWLKCKCLQIKPFVLGGFTHARGERAAVSTLLVGCYDAQGELRYAGNVGTGQGFSRAFLQTLYAEITAFEQASSPFPGFSPRELRSPWSQGRALSTHWLKPLLVVDIAFLEMSSRGQLRHPSFRKFRTDLQAHNVVRDITW